VETQRHDLIKVGQLSQGNMNRLVLMRDPFDNYNIWSGYLLMKVTSGPDKHLITITSDQSIF
jgi:hypothetical protein